jgi:hypothetical protein
MCARPKLEHRPPLLRPVGVKSNGPRHFLAPPIRLQLSPRPASFFGAAPPSSRWCVRLRPGPPGAPSARRTSWACSTPLPQLKTLDAGMEALPDGIGCCCAPSAQRRLSWPIGAQQRRTPAVTDSIPASKVLTTGAASPLPFRRLQEPSGARGRLETGLGRIGQGLQTRGQKWGRRTVAAEADLRARACAWRLQQSWRRAYERVNNHYQAQ